MKRGCLGRKQMVVLSNASQRPAFTFLTARAAPNSRLRVREGPGTLLSPRHSRKEMACALAFPVFSGARQVRLFEALLAVGLRTI